MTEPTANSENSKDKRLANLRPFKPGQSGNPSGRPKGTLKQFVQEMFMKMSEKEKKEWLKANKISGIDMWKMGEGLPKADVEHSGEVIAKIVSIDE